MTTETVSLGTAIQDEIKRVTALKEEYARMRQLYGFPPVAEMMMQTAIDSAVKALAEGDTVAIMRLYEELKGFTE